MSRKVSVALSRFFGQTEPVWEDESVDELAHVAQLKVGPPSSFS